MSSQLCHLFICIVTGWWLNLSKPQFPNVENEDNRIFLIRLWWELNTNYIYYNYRTNYTKLPTFNQFEYTKWPFHGLQPSIINYYRTHDYFHSQCMPHEHEYALPVMLHMCPTHSITHICWTYGEEKTPLVPWRVCMKVLSMVQDMW